MQYALHVYETTRVWKVLPVGFVRAQTSHIVDDPLVLVQDVGALE